MQYLEYLKRKKKQKFPLCVFIFLIFMERFSKWSCWHVETSTLIAELWYDWWQCARRSGRSESNVLIFFLKVKPLATTSRMNYTFVWDMSEPIYSFISYFLFCSCRIETSGNIQWIFDTLIVFFSFLRNMLGLTSNLSHNEILAS